MTVCAVPRSREDLPASSRDRPSQPRLLRAACGLHLHRHVHPRLTFAALDHAARKPRAEVILIVQPTASWRCTPSREASRHPHPRYSPRQPGTPTMAFSPASARTRPTQATSPRKGRTSARFSTLEGDAQVTIAALNAPGHWVGAVSRRTETDSVATDAVMIHGTIPRTCRSPDHASLPRLTARRL
jgi:hypothetical protein